MNPPTSDKQRSHTSIACQACKRRKSKCSGHPPPCQQCRIKQTVCDFQLDDDLRRRSSRHNFRACKALSDFVVSASNGDLHSSTVLLQTIQQTDLSGNLVGVARMYAEAVGMNSVLPAPNAEAQATSMESGGESGLFDSSAIESIAGESSIEGSPFSSSILEEPLETQDWPLSAFSGVQFRSLQPEPPDLTSHESPYFDDLPLLWAKINKPNPQLQRTKSALADSDSDWYQHHLISSEDRLTSSFLSFENATREMLRSGVDVSELIETATPCLDQLFDPQSTSSPHTAWSWSCQLAQAFSHLPFTLRLTTIYVAGILIRFLIHPSAETYNDIPLMLRPPNNQVSSQPTMGETTSFTYKLPPTHHGIKSFFFGRWDKDGTPVQSDLASGPVQSINWPYSDNACLAYYAKPRSSSKNSSLTLSRTFIEHIRSPTNYSIDSGGILGPMMMEEWRGV